MQAVGAANGIGDLVYSPDGFLVTEFVMLQWIYLLARSTGNDDAYTCLLDESNPAPPFGDIIPPNPRLECLDIGTKRTLFGLDSIFEFTAPEYIGRYVTRNYTWPPPYAHAFGDSITCSGKRVGDGTINAHDFAVLMWTQFRVPPYDTLFPTRERLGSIPTTAGLPNAKGRCGAPMSRQDYQILLDRPWLGGLCTNGYAAQEALNGTGVDPIEEDDLTGG
eukprot:3329079-Prymnesium_polylepis.1